jgi:AcrR family transcriptional regulator
MQKNARRGRRCGQPETKDAILRAARMCFGERGYDATTMRGIASVAGVDQALIAHYFGSKRGLFSSALSGAHVWDGLPERSDAATVRDSQTGERLVSTFLERWDTEAGPSALATLLRAAGSDEVAQRLLGLTVVDSIMTPAVGALSAHVDLPRLRVELIAAQLLGLAWLRYVERREPLASASARLLAKTYGPSLTATLTGRKLDRS